MTGVRARTGSRRLRAVRRPDRRGRRCSRSRRSTRASSDLTGTLTPDQQVCPRETGLAEFEARKGAQIAVLVVATTQPEEIEQYSIPRSSMPGRSVAAAPDDGALLLVAKDDRRLRIEVGRGLEGVLTDLVAKRIVSDIIAPQFKRGDYAGGIAAGVDQMIRIVDGEALPAPDKRWEGQGLGLRGSVCPCCSSA